MGYFDKKTLVVGTGKSGIAAAQLLLTMGKEILVYDGNKDLDPGKIKESIGTDTNLDIRLGDFNMAWAQELSLAVLSPGVPTDLPFIVKLREGGLPIWGEVELAYRFGKGRVAAITGTNGKTTTTALTGEIMKDYYESVFVVGNIGIPYTTESPKMKDDTVTVAEISSFMLETIEEFHPEVSAILNITPDHLNRHHTMENYIKAKEDITLNQTPEDACVLNYEDPVLREFGKKVQTGVIWFSSGEEPESGLYFDGTSIFYKKPCGTVKVCDVDELNLLGKHNYENVMAAVAIADFMGVPMESIRMTLKRFTAVEHRIEFVCEKNGVAYYNDSKGTNPDAAIKGIQAMNRPTYLIGGGYDKDSEYGEWIRSFDGKVKGLVLIGQTKEKIRDAALAEGFTAIELKDTFEEAIDWCASKAVPGEAVLLSPACASWGMFKNYEERGRIFKEYVRNM